MSKYILRIALFALVINMRSSCASQVIEVSHLPGNFNILMQSGLVWEQLYKCLPCDSRRWIRVNPTLPRIEASQPVEQLNRLPYPINYLQAYRTLNEAQRHLLCKQLPERERRAFQMCGPYAQDPFPQNVLLFLEHQLFNEQMSSDHLLYRNVENGRPWTELTQLLSEYPEIASATYIEPYIVNCRTTDAPILPNWLPRTKTIETRSPGSRRTTLAMRTCKAKATGLLEQILKTGFDPTESLPSECFREGQTPRSLLELPYAYPMLLAYSAKHNDVPEGQSKYRQLITALEDSVNGIAPDVAKLIIDFTPPDTIRALQEYRKDDKSPLDIELEMNRRAENLSQSDQSHRNFYTHILRERQKNIDMLIKSGVPAVQYPELLEQYIKQAQEKRWERWKRTTLIACTAGLAGLLWWFNKGSVAG